MKRRQLVIFFVLLSSFTLDAQSIESKLPETLDSLVANYWQPTVTAAFGTFTYSYGDLPSPFSRWLEDELGTAVSKSGKLKLFNRSAAAAMDPNFKTVYGDFFSKTGVDALLAGHFAQEGNDVKIHLELTSLTDGTLIGTTDVQVPTALVPSGLQIKPTPQVQELAADLSGVLTLSQTGGPAAYCFGLHG